MPRDESKRSGAAGAEFESRNADNRTAKLADRSLRLEPRSAVPLAVSTARRKLTHPTESRLPDSIRSTSSPGIGVEEPASRRKQSSRRRRCFSSNRGMEEGVIRIPRAIQAVEGERACPTSASKNPDTGACGRGG